MNLGSYLPNCQAIHYLPRRLAYASSALSPALPSGPSDQIILHRGKKFKSLKGRPPLLISNRVPVVLHNQKSRLNCKTTRQSFQLYDFRIFCCIELLLRWTTFTIVNSAKLPKPIAPANNQTLKLAFLSSLAPPIKLSATAPNLKAQLSTLLSPLPEKLFLNLCLRLSCIQ